MADVEKKIDPDVLTVRFNINDKEKISWLWDVVKATPEKIKLDPELNKYGVEVRMLAWGDPYNERGYVMDRIKRYLDYCDREELLEEMKAAGTYDSNEYESLDQLGELIEIWEKEADKEYGWEVTTKVLKERREEQKRQREFGRIDPQVVAGQEHKD